MKIIKNTYEGIIHNYKDSDPQVYFLAELIFYAYGSTHNELCEKSCERSINIILGIDNWIEETINCHQDLFEIIMMLTRGHSLRVTYGAHYTSGDYLQNNNSCHIVMRSEDVDSLEYEEIVGEDGVKQRSYKINDYHALDLIQKYIKVWALDKNDDIGIYYKSDIQVYIALQELYKKYELYGTRSFIVRKSDFPNIELANTLLFIFFELGIIEIDFDYQFLRKDKTKLPDDYKIKVTKDIRSTDLYSKIIEGKGTLNQSIQIQNQISKNNHILISDNGIDYIISYNNEKIVLTKQEMIVMNKFKNSKNNIVNLNIPSLPRTTPAFDQMLKRLRKKLQDGGLRLDKQRGTKKEYRLGKMDN